MGAHSLLLGLRMVLIRAIKRGITRDGIRTTTGVSVSEGYEMGYCWHRGEYNPSFGVCGFLGMSV